MCHEKIAVRGRQGVLFFLEASGELGRAYECRLELRRLGGSETGGAVVGLMGKQDRLEHLARRQSRGIILIRQCVRLR